MNYNKSGTKSVWAATPVLNYYARVSVIQRRNVSLGWTLVAMGNSEATNEHKAVCKDCGGKLVKSESFPNRPGFEIHKFTCNQCGLRTKAEVDTRFLQP
jgi:hypothetical protein